MGALMKIRGRIIRIGVLVGALLLPFCLPHALPAQGSGKRIYISVDMEGIAGAVAGDQILATGNEYQVYRKIMVGELLAAIAGAREAGATEFVVSDSHGGMHNLPIEDLPEDVKLIRGTPRPLGMMEGIDQGRYDGAMFIGYHASASNRRGVRAHTISSARLSEVKLNGVPASEGYLNAAVAGQFGVPVILVTGDDAVVEELASLKSEGVPVKRAIGFHAAESMTPAAAKRRIQEAARRAVARIGDYTPFKLGRAPVVDVTFHYYRPAEILSWLPTFQRSGPRSVRFKGQDMAAAAKLLSFIMAYSAELEP